MKKLILLSILIVVGCAPKIHNSYVGMTEQEFNKEKPNLTKYAIQKSILSNAALMTVDPEENKDLPYFYIDRKEKLDFIEWITFGKANAYFYYFDPETDTITYVQLGRDFSEKNIPESN